MPCLIILVLLGMPRVALFFVWLFGGPYLAMAFPSWLWPVLGFFFMPLTTLAFAYGINSLQPAGGLSDFAYVLVGIAVLLDLGVLTGGRTAQRRRAASTRT